LVLLVFSFGCLSCFVFVVFVFPWLFNSPRIFSSRHTIPRSPNPPCEEARPVSFSPPNQMKPKTEITRFKPRFVYYYVSPCRWPNDSSLIGNERHSMVPLFQVPPRNLINFADEVLLLLAFAFQAMPPPSLPPFSTGLSDPCT